MGIQAITTDFVGQVGVVPRIVRIQCNDDYDTVTSLNWLAGAATFGYNFSPSDYFLVNYGASNEFVQTFQSVVDSTGIILLPEGGTGESTENHITVYTDEFGTMGQDAATAINGGNIQAGLSGTAGYLASFPTTASKGSLRLTAVDNTGDTLTTISNAAMGQASVVSIPDPGAATANFIISKSAGTQSITSGNLAVTAGNLVAGASGAAGIVSSFPATAARGSLRLVAVANAGDTLTTISNAAMGQASVVSIPDPAAATASFVVAPAALVSGNLVKASGTSGLVVDAGAKLIAGTTAAYAGGGTSNAYAVTGLTVASVGSAVIRASTNAVSIAKALPGTDTLTITFSADPGAATTVDYIYATAAQT